MLRNEHWATGPLNVLAPDGDHILGVTTPRPGFEEDWRGYVEYLHALDPHYFNLYPRLGGAPAHFCNEDQWSDPDRGMRENDFSASTYLGLMILKRAISQSTGVSMGRVDWRTIQASGVLNVSSTLNFGGWGILNDTESLSSTNNDWTRLDNGTWTVPNPHPEWLCPWTAIDALYFSVTTMSTVGYGDLVPAEYTWGIMFAITGIVVFGSLTKGFAELLNQSTKGIANRVEGLVERVFRVGLIDHWQPSPDVALGIRAAALSMCFFGLHVASAYIFVAIEGWDIRVAFYHCAPPEPNRPGHYLHA